MRRLSMGAVETTWQVETGVQMAAMEMGDAFEAFTECGVGQIPQPKTCVTAKTLNRNHAGRTTSAAAQADRRKLG